MFLKNSIRKLFIYQNQIVNYNQNNNRTMNSPLIYQKYIARTYFIAWSFLLLLSIYNSVTYLTKPSHNINFLLQVIILRILLFFQLVNLVSKYIKLTTKSLIRKLFGIVYIALKILIIMIYLQDDTQESKAIPFILLFSLNGLLDMIITNKIIQKIINVKFSRVFQLLFLIPSILYYGFLVMNNYIKRYAEDIRYEEIHIIRIQQALVFCWIIYYLKKGIQQIFIKQNLTSSQIKSSKIRQSQKGKINRKQQTKIQNNKTQ